VKRRFDRRGLVLVAIAAVVIGLDQYTKYLVRTRLPKNVSWNPIPWLDRYVTFTHLDNTGAAFGLFQNMNLVFIIIAIVVIVMIALYYRQLAGSSWMLRLAFGLQMGGAAGNLIDRVVRGYVTDFIDVRIWPVFNLADSSVVVGTTLLAIYVFFMDQEENTDAPDGLMADTKD
jgi:signal peptidase II